MAKAPENADPSRVMGNRGVFASLGAGLSLVIAGVMVLVIVAGIVAFRGWDDLRVDDEAESVRMERVAAPQPERTVVGGETRSVRGASRSEAGRSRSSRRDGRDGRDSRGAGTARGGSRPDALRDGRGDSPGTPSGGPRASTPFEGSGASGGGGGREGGGGGGGTTPRTPDPVSRALEGVDRTVDHITEPKPEGSPPVDVPQVVDDTTQTTQEVVEDTTQVIKDVIDGTGDLLP